MKPRRKEHFLRVGSVDGRSPAHVEVPPLDETPVGLAAPVAERAGPVERLANGRFAGGEAARAVGRLGGLAKAERDSNRWGQRLGVARLLQSFPPEEHFAAALKDRAAWERDQAAHVCHNIGGRRMSPGVSSIITTASWERMFSILMFEAASSRPFAWDVDEKRTPKTLPRTDLIMVATRLGDSARQNLLAAHSLAVLEARSRSEQSDTGESVPWLVQGGDAKESKR